METRKELLSRFEICRKQLSRFLKACPKGNSSKMKVEDLKRYVETMEESFRKIIREDDEQYEASRRKE